MANEKPVAFTNKAWLESTAFGGFVVEGSFGLGHSSQDGGSFTKGALQFANIDIGQGETINFAQLQIMVSAEDHAGGNFKYRAWGVRENNPDGGYPFGRTKTSASATQDHAMPSVGQMTDINVTSLLQEIVNQSGFSRFNNVQFLLEDNGSGVGTAMSANESQTYLVYRINAEPNFKPTPKSVSPPTFPSADDYGIKISFPGQNVLTATTDELLFTTRKDFIKMSQEGQVNTVAGVEYLIPHGLGYAPQAMCFVRKNSLSFQLPRLFGGASDPVGGGVEGYCAVDATYLRITTFVDAAVYFYIFLDEQSS